MAASGSSETFGWELIYTLAKKELTRSEDLVILITHWLLLKRGFKCAGLGEDFTIPRANELSELLPQGWNNTPYRLRYYDNKDLVIVSGMTVDSETFIVNLLDARDNRISSATFKLIDIKPLDGSQSELNPDYSVLISILNKDLLDDLLKREANKTVQTQTSVNLTEESPRGRPRPQPPPPDILPPLGGIPQRPSLPFGIGGPSFGGVGSADLNPFAPLQPGGGMLFQPPGVGPRPGYIDPEIPRGSVPPGARYDPFQPPPGGPRPPRRGTDPNHPDFDHLPPPGYDDMFM